MGHINALAAAVVKCHRREHCKWFSILNFMYSAFTERVRFYNFRKQPISTDMISDNFFFYTFLVKNERKKFRRYKDRVNSITHLLNLSKLKLVHFLLHNQRLNFLEY